MNLTVPARQRAVFPVALGQIHDYENRGLASQDLDSARIFRIKFKFGRRLRPEIIRAEESMGLGAWLRRAIATVSLTPAILIPGIAWAADAPSEIKVGTLYSGSGQLSSTSMPLHAALEYWADGLNKSGGVYVKAFDKKIPIHLIAYDDQSSPALAANLTNQLITRDKVDILTTDSTSIMTASAVPVARDHKMLLWDLTGSSPKFFSPDNPYVVLLGLAATDRYAKSVVGFVPQMQKLGVKTVAMLYLTADYTAIQAEQIRKAIQAESGLKIVFDRGIPANTTDYTVFVNDIAALKPDAVFEFGYPANEISFLRALQDNGAKFNFLYTVYGLSEQSLMATNSVADQLPYSYSLAGPAAYAFKVNYGLDLPHFKRAFETWVEAHNHGVEFGYNAVAGYHAGLVIEKALGAAESLDQLELRRAVFTLSGQLETLAGKFELAADGSQNGLIAPMGQLLPAKGQLVPGKENAEAPGFNIVAPPELATAKPVYPAP
jgi:branched-chain amino acid transport system substrate-binding protein